MTARQPKTKGFLERFPLFSADVLLMVVSL
jgi:hypothetical protein